MRSNIFLVFVLFSLNSMSFAKSDPVAFVTQFYKTYLNSKKVDSIKTAVLSKSAMGLLDSNQTICKEKAGTDVCGYDADGDMFLNTQEIGPNLNFSNASFKARLVSPNIVEVSFSVWPGQEKDYTRKMQLSLVNEKGQWKIDDISVPDDDGKYKVENSMKYLIKKEIEY